MVKVLTVSIASYNVEKFLDKTLESFIVPEVMDKIEVIVVNDGSKDNTVAVAQKYVDKYPNTFKVIDKQNGGYGSTINAAVPVATGKYYRLLDGDDWFDKEGLKNFVNELEKSDEDMIISKFKRVFESDGHEEERDETVILKKTSGTFDDVELSDWFTMHATTFKTEIFQKNNIKITEHCFYTDQEYDLLPLRFVKTIKKIPVCLYCYRIGRAEQSVSPAGMAKHYKEQMTVFKKVFEVYSNVENASDAKDKYICSYLAKRLRLYLLSCLVLDSTSEHKSDIKNFMAYCKKTMPKIYKTAINNSKKLRLLVMSQFLAYGMLHKKELRGSNKDMIA